MRRSSDATPRPILPRQNLLGLFRILAAATDGDQHTDEIANHVLQKCVGGKVECDQRVVSRYSHGKQAPHRRRRLAPRRSERREIVLTQPGRGR